MKRLFIALLIAVMFAVGLVHVYAANGDVKVTIWDNTTSTLVITCTNVTSPCSANLIRNHNYSLTLNEVSNQTYSGSRLDVKMPIGVPSAWTSRVSGWAYNFGLCTSNPFTYLDSGTTWRLSGQSVPANTNCMYWQNLAGTTGNFASSGQIIGQINRYPVGLKSLTINYNVP